MSANGYALFCVNDFCYSHSRNMLRPTSLSASSMYAEGNFRIKTTNVAVSSVPNLLNLLYSLIL